MAGKTKLQMRADMRLDLKDSGALWSNPELNRCIERAVSDLSRFLPKEGVYEVSLQFTVTSEAVTFPKDTDADAVVAAEDISAFAADSTATIDGQPDVPRILTITITDADDSITGMTIEITGIDEDDIGIVETFHYIKGDAKSWAGKKCFKAVYEVKATQIAGAAASDVLEVGYGAYTGVWVSLANKPVKWGSEKNVAIGATSLTRNTDFYMDYTQGKIKAISGGNITAEGSVTISYTKSQLGIDLSSLADFIRVERVEYPIGDIPQSFVDYDIWDKVVYPTGDIDSQSSMAEDKHIGVHYAAEHIPPTEYSPGSHPEFLDNTILMSADAFALFIYAEKQEMAAETDLASARTELGLTSAVHTLLAAALAAATSAQSSIDSELGNTTAVHTLLATALVNVKKYLDNNSNADSAGILQDITDDVANLRTAIAAAVDAANTYLDAVAADLTSADAVFATSAAYVTGATAPSIKKYLEDGDAFLNTVDVGGEGTTVARAYAEYARSTAEILRAYEAQRTDYLQDATARTNAALGYTQEAAQRISSLRSYIEQAMGYRDVASVFARQAEAYITQIGTYLREAETYTVQIASYVREAESYQAQINAYLAEASRYIDSAGSCMVLADRFRDEAIERRNEVWSIWRDRKQYIGDYVGAPVRQHPQYQE